MFGSGTIRVREQTQGVTVGVTKKGAIVPGFVLWLLAVILVVIGIVQLLQGQIILGLVLIIAGCLVGPGGYSIFRSRA